jgi:hypothetical protein
MRHEKTGADDMRRTRQAIKSAEAAATLAHDALKAEVARLSE